MDQFEGSIGCLNDVRHLLSDLHITPVVRDERCVGQAVEVTFRGALRPEQKSAVDALLTHDTGVLSATTAFGKTVVAAWLIAQRGVNTLVLVHRRQLLDQWVDRLSTFLGVERTAIGRIGGGRYKPTGHPPAGAHFPRGRTAADDRNRRAHFS
jgi:superfamily II DNA or RNA helicase